MSAFLSSRLAIGLLALFSLLTTVALTIGGISLTRAGIVSVLPVTSQQSGITVCGHGKATAKPDQARLSLGVFANAASAQDARNQAAQVMTNVLAALKSNGVGDQDIQTEYIAIQPQYTYESGDAAHHRLQRDQHRQRDDPHRREHRQGNRRRHRARRQ